MKEDPVIVYFEDDAKSRTVVSIILTKRMSISHVTIFEDSTDFLARVEAVSPPPDLILLDIHIKPYNGFKMLSMLRSVERFKSVPVAALTASVMNEEIQNLRDAGFGGCLSKPVNLSLFPQQIERLLNGEHVWSII